MRAAALLPLLLLAGAAGAQEGEGAPKRYDLRRTYQPRLGDRVAVEVSTKRELAAEPQATRAAAAGRDGAPYTSTSFKGECHYDMPEVPPDVTCSLRVLVSGTHKARPAEPGDDP